VNPAGFTRIVPRVALIVELMTVAEAVVPVLAFDVAPVLLATAEDGDDEQAAATRPTARTAPTTRRRDARPPKRDVERPGPSSGGMMAGTLATTGTPEGPEGPDGPDPPIGPDRPDGQTPPPFVFPSNEVRLPRSWFPWVIAWSSASLQVVEMLSSGFDYGRAGPDVHRIAKPGAAR
jgi:hypothetical protein